VGKYPVRLHPGAEEDIAHGREWYEERNPIVADAFMAEVDHAMDLIAEAPDRWPVKYKRFRCYVFEDFPYSAFYLATPSEVHVIAVAPERRKPRYWKPRK
jgi:toxin ParE1/3/4